MRTFLPHSLCYHRVRTISLSISIPSSFFLLVFHHNGSARKTAQLNYFRYPALLKLRIFVEEQCFLDHTKRYMRQDDPKEFLQFPRCSDPDPPILLFGAVPLSPHGRNDRAYDAQCVVLVRQMMQFSECRQSFARKPPLSIFAIPICFLHDDAPICCYLFEHFCFPKKIVFLYFGMTNLKTRIRILGLDFERAIPQNCSQDHLSRLVRQRHIFGICLLHIF